MVKVISSDQLYRKINSFIESAFGTPVSEQLVIVEVSSSESYNVMHLKGAVHTTLERIQQQVFHRPFNPMAEMIIYGENSLSLEPRVAIRSLEQQGLFNLFFYRGGKEDWIRAGLWIQTSLVPADHGDQMLEKKNEKLLQSI